jgi:hypothetical protein
MLGLSIGWNGGDGWVPLGDVDRYAQICNGPSLRSRHLRTTGAAT